jgi:radical SAM superfamily enzyme YgiQ (UPF0313 family)
MDILLISSYTMKYVTREDRSPPLSLLCLAAVLRQAGHQVHLMDLVVLVTPEGVNQETYYLEKIRQAVRDISPGMVGINCLLSSHFPFVRRAAAGIKEEVPDMPVVIGGIHPTLFSREILANCPQIDAIVLGEGENQAVAVAEAFSRKDSPNDLSHIEALAYRDNGGRVVLNQRTGYIQDLDRLPMPAWDLMDIEGYFVDHSTWYNPRNLDIKMSVPIMTSRSCPYDCSFCSSRHLMGRGLRLRDPRRVVDEMQWLYERHDLNYFGFVDDNLTLNKKHILSICNEIIKRGMVIEFESFNGYNLASLDAEIVSAMVEAGCVYVILPIEHGDDRMRNEIIGKRLPREKIYEVVELYKAHNLLTRGVFIMGFPEDTAKTLDETLKLIHELQLDMTNVFNLIPFPGTKIFDQADRDGLFLQDIDMGRLWEGNWDLNAVQNQFYLKPYHMTITELQNYRRRFDDLRFMSDRIKELQRGRTATTTSI